MAPRGLARASLQGWAVDGPSFDLHEEATFFVNPEELSPPGLLLGVPRHLDVRERLDDALAETPVSRHGDQ